MRRLNLRWVTFVDLFLTIVLSLMSLVSDFPKELTTIFFLSFLFRLVFNFISSDENYANPKLVAPGDKE